MERDTLDRLQGLFDKFKAFPEAGPPTSDGTVPLRKDAFCAFLEARQIFEREVLPYASSEVRRAEKGTRFGSAQAIADNLNRHVQAKEDVFRRLRSAEERNIHSAIAGMRKRGESLEGADGMLRFFNAMLDVMGGSHAGR